jgi:hypothetical protein
MSDNRYRQAGTSQSFRQTADGFGRQNNYGGALRLGGRQALLQADFGAAKRFDQRMLIVRTKRKACAADGRA